MALFALLWGLRLCRCVFGARRVILAVTHIPIFTHLFLPVISITSR